MLAEARTCAGGAEPFVCPKCSLNWEASLSRSSISRSPALDLRAGVEVHKPGALVRRPRCPPGTQEPTSRHTGGIVEVHKILYILVQCILVHIGRPVRATRTSQPPYRNSSSFTLFSLANSEPGVGEWRRALPSRPTAPMSSVHAIRKYIS
jgi:hypothetical protein